MPNKIRDAHTYTRAAEKYQIDEIAIERKWGVRVRGSTAYLSKHDKEQAARAAVAHYEAADKRRNGLG